MRGRGQEAFWIKLSKITQKRLKIFIKTLSKALEMGLSSLNPVKDLL